MIVIDASAMVEALLGSATDRELMDVLAGDISAPHLLDVDVTSVLRALTLAGKATPEAAEQARRTYFEFAVARVDFGPLADRVWALRRQFTSYDANYLALAEALDAELFTCDHKLDTRGHHAKVRVLQRTT
ncbi:type II toxin-antitoxin system VapC family toxin [Leekyejoonella antrihumi]|uniref:Ribonuclease VapC n=1 Tax=Leekyejoonella antrihumi TaxID=1660198 RepID=A0A563E7T9_9MICO|nr:type II toxin-antitoxin system VapC family toxin [Leekyejoonella antrihumi]TWP38505.1 type II toxin-antitoxin system VapC family toxin [Leekyejoonella antrihumi]